MTSAGAATASSVALLTFAWAVVAHHQI
jgi:hypothetical protein